MSKPSLNMSHGAEIAKVARYCGVEPEAILDYSSNINPWGFTAALREAACKALELSPVYPEARAESFIRDLSLRRGHPATLLLPGNGASDLIYRLANFLALGPARGKKQLLLAPSFSEYAKALRAQQLELAYYYLSPANDFCLDEQILASLTREVGSLWLCQPNNPTGQLIAPELLVRIRQRCKDLGIYLIQDECFLDFLPPEESIKYSLRVNLGGREIIIKSLTKLFAIPGLRLAWLELGSQDVSERLAALTPEWQISRPALAAGLAALQTPPQEIQSWRAQLDKEKPYLKSCLETFAAEHISGEANYLFFKHRDKDLQAKFLSLLPRPMLIRSCANYAGLGPGYYRIAVKAPADNQEFARALLKLEESADV